MENIEEDLEERIKTQEAELVQLKEVLEYNKIMALKKKLGRPTRFSEGLTETICFKTTKVQKEKLEIIKEKGITLSDFIRQAIFGD